MGFLRLLSPEQLLARWNGLPLQLALAWSWGLPVYSAKNGKLMGGYFEDSCLTCRNGGVDGSCGSWCREDFCLRAGGVDPAISMMQDSLTIFDRADDELIGVRLASGPFVFDLDDVEAIEQAQGLVQVVGQAEAVQVGETPGGYEKPMPDDEPVDYIERLQAKGVNADEIQFRIYEFQPKRWALKQWQVNCLVHGIPYPPEGSKGDSDRNKYGRAYQVAKKRHLARGNVS